MSDERKLLAMVGAIALVAGTLFGALAFRHEVEITGWKSAFCGGWTQYAPLRIEYEGVTYDCIPRHNPTMWRSSWPDLEDVALDHLAEQRQAYSSRLDALTKSVEGHRAVLAAIDRRREKYRTMLGFNEPPPETGEH